MQKKKLERAIALSLVLHLLLIGGLLLSVVGAEKPALPKPEQQPESEVEMKIGGNGGTGETLEAVMVDTAQVAAEWEKRQAEDAEQAKAEIEAKTASQQAVAVPIKSQTAPNKAEETAKAEQAKKAAAEKAAKVKAENVAAEKAKAEKAKVEQIKAEQIKAEQAKKAAESEKNAKAKLAAEKAAAEKAAAEKAAKAKADKVAAEKAKTEKAKTEQAKAEKAKAEQAKKAAEAEKNAKAKLAAEKAAAEKAAAEKAAKAKAEKAAAEKAAKAGAEKSNGDKGKTASDKAESQGASGEGNKVKGAQGSAVDGAAYGRRIQRLFAARYNQVRKDESMAGQRCNVRIQVARDGSIVNYQIQSGNEAVCNAATFTLNAVRKLPAAPSDGVYEKYKSIVIGFTANGVSAQ